VKRTDKSSLATRAVRHRARISDESRHTLHYPATFSNCAEVRQKSTIGTVIILLILLALITQTDTPISYKSLTRQARRDAKRPYKPQQNNVPEELSKLNYDEYTAIKYRNNEALWAGEGLNF
jgi:glucan biosynthesis protein